MGFPDGSFAAFALRGGVWCIRTRWIPLAGVEEVKKREQKRGGERCDEHRQQNAVTARIFLLCFVCAGAECSFA